MRRRIVLHAFFHQLKPWRFENRSPIGNPLICPRLAWSLSRTAHFSRNVAREMIAINRKRSSNNAAQLLSDAEEIGVIGQRAGQS